jgi:tripartite-type tricarboxylate transporter receptor subunit TctC
MRSMRRARARLAGIVFICAVPAAALAQPANFPTKPVRLVVPGAAGVSGDITARLIAQKLGERWNQQLVVDNRPGAGGILGAQAVALATPDGYTLLLTNPGPGLQNVILRRKPAYALSDFAPIVFVGYTPLIIAANPRLPASNVKELVAFAKAHPGKIRWASAGNGSNPHTALEIFKHLTKTDILHVAYKGGTAPITGLISSEVDAYYTTLATTESHIAAGRLKVLAVGGNKRLAALPEVPTLAEQGIDKAGANYWYGLVATAGTPQPIVDRINRDVNAVLETTEIRTRFAQLGIELEGGTPEAFAKFLKAEADQLTALVKAGALQPVD